MPPPVRHDSPPLSQRSPCTLRPSGGLALSRSLSRRPFCKQQAINNSYCSDVDRWVDGAHRTFNQLLLGQPTPRVCTTMPTHLWWRVSNPGLPRVALTGPVPLNFLVAHAPWSSTVAQPP